MSPQLLDLLKLGMLVLLYLFFVRVMWAVWSELRPASIGRASGPGVERQPMRRSPRQPRSGVELLRIVEPADRAGTEFLLAAELSIGRVPGCTITIDDTYVSQHHARVWLDGDQHRIEDLGSTNGTVHNGRLLTAPAVLHSGDRIQVGGTVMEVA